MRYIYHWKNSIFFTEFDFSKWNENENGSDGSDESDGSDGSDG